MKDKKERTRIPTLIKKKDRKNPQLEEKKQFKIQVWAQKKEANSKVTLNYPKIARPGQKKEQVGCKKRGRKGEKSEVGGRDTRWAQKTNGNNTLGGGAAETEHILPLMVQWAKMQLGAHAWGKDKNQSSLGTESGGTEPREGQTIKFEGTVEEKGGKN